MGTCNVAYKLLFSHGCQTNFHAANYLYIKWQVTLAHISSGENYMLVIIVCYVIQAIVHEGFWKSMWGMDRPLSFFVSGWRLVQSSNALSGILGCFQKACNGQLSTMTCCSLCFHHRLGFHESTELSSSFASSRDDHQRNNMFRLDRVFHVLHPKIFALAHKQVHEQETWGKHCLRVCCLTPTSNRDQCGKLQ